MKKSLVLALLILVSLSCSNNDSIKYETNAIDYSAMNKSIDNQINTLLNKVVVNNTNEEEYLKYFKIQPKSANTDKVITLQKTIKVQLAPHYNQMENEFMLNFYQDLANSYDNQIIHVLNSKKLLLNEGNFSKDFKDEAYFLFNTIEKITNEINKPQTNKTRKSSGFGDCIAREGKTIGRSVATGALVGAATGALTGAAGGTVALPGIGTATGAIGGAVFGAAKGAVGGGFTALVWAAVDCAMERNRFEATYLYGDDFYNEILFPYDSDYTNYNTILNYETLSNLIFFTSDDTFLIFIE